MSPVEGKRKPSRVQTLEPPTPKKTKLVLSSPESQRLVGCFFVHGLSLLRPRDNLPIFGRLPKEICSVVFRWFTQLTTRVPPLPPGLLTNEEESGRT